jgi:hypothetical protein
MLLQPAERLQSKYAHLPVHRATTSYAPALLVNWMRLPTLDKPIRKTLNLQGRERLVQIACRKVVTTLGCSIEHLQLDTT